MYLTDYPTKEQARELATELLKWANDGQLFPEQP
jgi:hypothetical protein